VITQVAEEGETKKNRGVVQHLNFYCVSRKKKCHHKFVSAQRFSLSTFTIDTLTTKRESERENDDA
jgi:hypothetical protein